MYISNLENTHVHSLTCSVICSNNSFNKTHYLCPFELLFGHTNLKLAEKFLIQEQLILKYFSELTTIFCIIINYLDKNLFTEN